MQLDVKGILFRLPLLLCLIGVRGFSQLSHPSRPKASALYSSSTKGILSVLDSTSVLNPTSGLSSSALDGLSIRETKNKENDNKNPFAFFLGNGNPKSRNQKTIVIVMPQLGDFDSAEYAELLAAVKPDLDRANISLRIIGIGDAKSAKMFADFAGLPLETIRVDSEGKLHRALSLHGGPDWDIPSFIPDSLLKWFQNYVGDSKETTKEGRALVARSWLNYMAMCAGIAAPDTLPEIIRGYIGDKSAPERLRADETVRVGDVIAVTGVTDVKLGPIEYQSLWKNEKGYQRPAELATVRLRVMVEILSNFRDYVPDQKHLHLRGATFIFDEDGELEFEHRDTGVLAYSKTMARPLAFLQPYIGDKALNPLDLGDNAVVRMVESGQEFAQISS
jgi:AhpC/TSA antioxidant enzyme